MCHVHCIYWGWAQAWIWTKDQSRLKLVQALWAKAWELCLPWINLNLFSAQGSVICESPMLISLLDHIRHYPDVPALPRSNTDVSEVVFSATQKWHNHATWKWSELVWGLVQGHPGLWTPNSLCLPCTVFCFYNSTYLHCLWCIMSGVFPLFLNLCPIALLVGYLIWLHCL